MKYGFDAGTVCFVCLACRDAKRQAVPIVDSDCGCDRHAALANAVAAVASGPADTPGWTVGNGSGLFAPIATPNLKRNEDARRNAEVG